MDISKIKCLGPKWQLVPKSNKSEIAKTNNDFSKPGCLESRPEGPFFRSSISTSNYEGVYGLQTISNNRQIVVHSK